ncbi:MAG: 4-hydroxy-tetrahydrodipicolinate synthase [Selenomonadales bacterium]|nr:4-hydroxy-tetrahydrodipicolinate synthase [Selenomonadales bacterium]MBQ2246294.1 4-hydroxy-tetrahydrodipicolinate synthase [Selenomonadales bacterium]
MKDFGRVITAMVTPFHEDGSVNYEGAAELARHLVANGSDGLVVAGSTGEAATMTAEEKLKLFEVVLEAVGDRASVIAGTGSNDTMASVKFTQAAEKVGVHGALVVGPYYNKPTQEGFYQHFKTIAEATSLPIMLYNVPGRTASNIAPETVARLAEIPNIVAIKEASGNIEQATEIIRVTPADFKVYSGDDAMTLPLLAVGGEGIVSVAGHVVGNQIQAMIQAFLAGDIKKAQEINLSILPVFKAMFIVTNPIPVKTSVGLLGLPAGPLRLPLTAADDAVVAKLKAVLATIQ